MLISESFTGEELNISKNVLSFVPVDIFTSNGKADSISGDWSTKTWITAYNSEPAYTGYLECTYQINTTDSTYFHQILFLNNPDI
jgi:hypothetical protein